MISIIVPVYNESASLSELVQQILTSIRKNHLPLKEIIFINDGSTDDSLKKIQSLQKKDKRIRLISFRKNFGKAIALKVGMMKAKGDIIVTMDGDLQDGAENLPLLIQQLDNYDLVVGWKKNRLDPLGKRLPSKAFNAVVRHFAALPIHDFNSGFKAMRKAVSDELDLYGEMHRFIPVLAKQKGFRVGEIAVIHHQRLHGQSKYGWKRLWRGFFDFLTVMFLGSYGQRPLHLFGFLGILSIFLGMVLGIYLTTLHFQGRSIGDRPLLFLAILLILAGLQMLLSGLIAEMIVLSQQRHNLTDLPIDYEN
ncbi:MAG: glycosyltransferase family 2 protein [Patescibacteria group bacterium]|nr:glycosyltransferase family 2 protein [Patescibacteria group bacterium]